MGARGLASALAVRAGQHRQVAHGGVQARGVVQGVEHQQVRAVPVVRLAVVVPGLALGVGAVPGAVEVVVDEGAAHERGDPLQQGREGEELRVGGHLQFHERGRTVPVRGQGGGDRVFSEPAVDPVVHLGQQAPTQVVGQQAGEDEVAGCGEAFSEVVRVLVAHGRGEGQGTTRIRTSVFRGAGIVHRGTRPMFFDRRFPVENNGGFPEGGEFRLFPGSIFHRPGVVSRLSDESACDLGLFLEYFLDSEKAQVRAFFWGEFRCGNDACGRWGARGRRIHGFPKIPSGAGVLPDCEERRRGGGDPVPAAFLLFGATVIARYRRARSTVS